MFAAPLAGFVLAQVVAAPVAVTASGMLLESKIPSPLSPNVRLLSAIVACDDPLVMTIPSSVAARTLSRTVTSVECCTHMPIPTLDATVALETTDAPVLFGSRTPCLLPPRRVQHTVLSSAPTRRTPLLVVTRTSNCWTVECFDARYTPVPKAVMLPLETSASTAAEFTWTPAFGAGATSDRVALEVQ